MTITFQDCYDLKLYEVEHIEYGVDGDGIPVDIVIWAKKSILEEIGEKFSSYGYNIQHLSESILAWNRGVDTDSEYYEALFARLHPFNVEGQYQCYFSTIHPNF